MIQCWGQLSKPMKCCVCCLQEIWPEYGGYYPETDKSILVVQWRNYEYAKLEFDNLSYPGSHSLGGSIGNPKLIEEWITKKTYFWTSVITFSGMEKLIKPEVLQAIFGDDMITDDKFWKLWSLPVKNACQLWYKHNCVRTSFGSLLRHIKLCCHGSFVNATVSLMSRGRALVNFAFEGRTNLCGLSDCSEMTIPTCMGGAC